MSNKICIFGASITHGFYDTELGGWADRLKQYIGFKKVTHVYNLGISSDTTEDLLKRIKIELAARKPTLVIFAIGNNDSAHVINQNKNQIPIEQFESNVQRLIKAARRYTDKIVYIGLTPVDEKRVNPWRNNLFFLNKNIKKYDETIEKVCHSENIQFIKLRNQLNSSKYLNQLHDGLHPNARGHQLIFKIVKENIIKIIKLN